MTSSSRTPSRLARTTLALLAALATALATLVAVAAVPAEADTTRIDPQRLERGEDASVPYVEGRRIIDGATTTRVRHRYPRLLGTRPDGRYVVLVEDHRGAQVRAYTPGGGGRKILGDVPGAFDVVLGTDGATLVTGRLRTGERRRTLLRAFDSTSGELVGTRKRKGYLNPLDANATTVVYAGEDGPVVSWDLSSGAGTRLSPRYGYRADLTTDRLAVFTEDPYQGGCTVVSTLSAPEQELWRSCEEAVVRFSPDGSHQLTTFILADGLGPDVVDVRTIEGERTGRYQVEGYFEHFLFEDADTALLGAVTRESSAMVRCEADTCELASDLRPGERWL